MVANSVLILTVMLLARLPEAYSLTGTTPNIQSVFKGRCWDYKETRYKDLLPRVATDCDTLWNKFFAAFSYKHPCKVTKEGYEPFLKSATQSLPNNKVMFWSGVFSLAHRYAKGGARYVTLEDTLIGYLANSLQWCGQESAPGMNLNQCPEWADCPIEASESFWAGASETFASQAKGQVTIMVDGSNPDKPAYRKDSFFGKYELPSLDTKVVRSLNVIVTHALGKPKIEVCNKGSLVTLKKDVTARGLTFSCVDDPVAVLHLLCSDDPESRECQLVLAHNAGELSYDSTP